MAAGVHVDSAVDVAHEAKRLHATQLAAYCVEFMCATRALPPDASHARARAGARAASARSIGCTVMTARCCPCARVSAGARTPTCGSDGDRVACTSFPVCARACLCGTRTYTRSRAPRRCGQERRRLVLRRRCHHFSTLEEAGKLAQLQTPICAQLFLKRSEAPLQARHAAVDA
eukprot:164762-Pleurochrysis_carterae.AAC.1